MHPAIAPTQGAVFSTKNMKIKTVGQTWRLKSGLLYAGMNGLLAAFVGPDDAMIFDSRDNPKIKTRFYGALLGSKFEVELCN